MRNILNKIYVHPIFIITAFVCALIGEFKLFTAFTLLILSHEVGHIIFSIIFKWKIDKIIILPFGGLTKFKSFLNKPLLEEFIICIMGPIFQMIFFILLKDNIDYKYFIFCNYLILLFNLLPIYPLDGSKMFNIILNKITSFYTGYILTILISYLVIFIFIINTIHISFIALFISIFLFKENIDSYLNRNIIFNKFLLERYMYKIKFKKIKIINNIKKMKRDYYHIFYKNNTYEKEDNILAKMFDK